MTETPSVRLDREAISASITVDYPPVNALRPGVPEGIIAQSGRATPILRSAPWC